MLAMIDRMSSFTRHLIAVALLIAVAYVDVRTGTEVSVQFFYLVPIALLAWYEKRRSGIIAGIIASLAVLVPSFAEGRDAFTGPTPYWNAVVACLTFVAFALTLATLRAAVDRLAAMSRTDPLTEISNRRSFMETATRELSRARRSGHPFAVMYIDLDNFKHVNDTLGHGAGDSLLRTVGAELRAATRSTDIVARLGGDEFAILLPETKPDGAIDAAAKIRARLLASMNLGGWPVTFSIGLVSCVKLPESFASVVDAADRLMYSVKKSGKNGLATMQV
jgi:diguanylate cyclase (GGDEF)-like protein